MSRLSDEQLGQVYTKAAQENKSFGIKAEIHAGLRAVAEAAVQAEREGQEAVKWFNGCDESVPAALRYLADNPKPTGPVPYCGEHLYQLAEEIERMAKKPLYTTPPAAPVPEDVTKDAERYRWLLLSGTEAEKKIDEALAAAKLENGGEG